MSRGNAKYDVIIVGGGPAGSTAGYLLSNFGYNVLIVDKSHFPRRKLCGGLITHKTLSLLDRIFGETEDSLNEQHILDFKAEHYEVFYKKRLLVKNSSNIPFYFVDRNVYDHFLLKKAKRAGTKIIEGEAIKSIDPPSSEVVTVTDRKFKANFIIGADGVNSLIRRELILKGELNASKWPHNLSSALGIFVKRKQMREAPDHPMLFFGLVNWGYSWVFPNRKSIFVGLGGLNNKNSNFLNLFYKFLSILNLSYIDASHIIGHSVPYGNFLLRPFFKNFILVGDSAGLADPITGEGIFYAHRSAELVAKAIQKCMHRERENAGTRYLKYLQRFIFPDLVHARKLRKLVFSSFDKVQYYPARILLNVFNAQLTELVHGVRQYKGLKKRIKYNELV